MSNIPDNVLVDDCDREMLETMGKWYIGGRGYCIKSASRKIGKRKNILMHRVILGLGDSGGLVIDHINSNTLDNRRCNLRIVTQQQNCFNRKAKGYTWNKQANKWQAQIKTNGKLLYLGCFDTEEQAHAAYLMAKTDLHKI